MNELIPIFEVDGVPVTTSRAVAEQFGKQHKNVIQSIESIMQELDETEEGKEFGRLNFQPSTYRNTQNKEQPMYIMTRDGFTLLAMGFTGSKALQFKLAYINAFNRMEELIRGGRATNKQLESTFSSLAAIDTAAEQGKADIVALTVAETLAALSSAINNGAYSLYRKNKPDNRTGNGKIIGAYDDYCIIVKAKALYEVYVANTKRAIAFSAWKEFIKSCNYKYAKGKYGGGYPVIASLFLVKMLTL